MVNMLKKAVAAVLMLVMLLAFPGGMMEAEAATGKITFSDPTVTVGNQVSVTMKIATGDGNLGASDVMLQYDASKLEFTGGTGANGGAGSIRVLGTMEAEGQKVFTFTLKFKALEAGDTGIKVQSQEVYDSDSQPVSISHIGGSTVKVAAPATYSKEAGLAGLEISPGTLSPAFSSDVTSYSATVGGDVSKVTVSARAKDGKARVVVSGNDNLQTGANTITCKVTAEDGETVRTYTIAVTKQEGAPEPAPSESPAESVPEDANAQGSGMTAEVEGKTLQVASSFDESVLPEGFSSAEFMYNGQNVQSAFNEAGSTRLLYLTDDTGAGEFYLYNESTGTFSPYVTIKMTEKSIVVLSPSELPADLTLPKEFADCTIDIGSHSVRGWIWTSQDGSVPEYCVVYGMNSQGEKHLYRYDQKEMTLQRYFEDPESADVKAKLAEVAGEFNDLLDDYKIRGWIIAGLFAVSIILAIVLVVVLLNKKSDEPFDKAPKSSKKSTEEKKDRLREENRRPARRKRPEKEDYFDDIIEDLDEIDTPDPEEFEGTGKITRRPRPAAREDRVERVEKDLEAELAKEAESAVRSKKKHNDAEDDFEFIDLDL